MHQFGRIVLSILVYLCIITSIVHAGQEGIQQKVSSALNHLLGGVEDTLGSPGHFSFSKLEVPVAEFRAARLLFEEHLRNRALKVQHADSLIQARHEEFSSRLRANFERIEELIGYLRNNPDAEGLYLAELADVLKEIVASRPPAIHSAMPYQPLDLQTRQPLTVPVVIPAYQSGAAGFVSADLQESPEAPHSQRIYQQAISIAEAAGKQNWDPVDLYQWVKNNIRTEWYWGSMKGAVETLRQGCGNDADQASLLVALFRAAGYPARYVRGVIEFFPDIGMAKQLFDVVEVEQIGELLRRAGIPHQPVMNDLEVVNYQLEHIWVEVQVPYANYRGAMADSEGKLWLPLDTSIKVAGFDEVGELDLFSAPGEPLTTLRDDYLAAAQQETPIDFARRRVGDYLTENFPSLQYNAVLHRRTAREETLDLLSTMPQFTEVVVTGEYHEMPDELVHKVHISATEPVTQEPLFATTLPVRDLTSRNIHISFDPETVTDQETINQWGGLDNVPAYLVRLRPVLVVDGERKAAGLFGLAAGQDFQLDLSIRSPSASAEVTNRVTAGYPLVVGLGGHEIPADLLEGEAGKAHERLHQTAMSYIDRWNRDEHELAEMFDLRIVRPLVSVVAVGGVIKVSELMGEPQSLSWQGLFVDADSRVVAAIPGSDPDARELSFMQLSALQGSALEHLVLEDQFGVESVSTTRLLSLAQESGTAVLQINAENVADLLPSLSLGAAVEEDVASAVDAGMIITIPESPLSFHSWSGVGYLKEDPLSGAAGYMLSGQIAGGSTALGKALWDESLVEVMEHPNQGQPNTEIDAAYSLVALTPLQTRMATAGVALDASLMARVQDQTRVPVAGAPVTFSVKKGGGWLVDDSVEPVQLVQQLTTQSDYSGIARAKFTPGESVYENPLVVTRPGDAHASIVGENIIDAQLAAGSLAALEAPIVVLGFAGPPDASRLQTLGDGKTADVLSYAGDAGMILQDRFGNPVANYAVDFSLLPPQLMTGSACSQELVDAAKTAEMVGMDDPCVRQLPVHGECRSATGELSLESRSDGSVVAGVVLGGLAGADYGVNMAFGDVSGAEQTRAVHLYSADNGACGVADAPVEKLVLSYPRLRDADGRNVDARPAGADVQLDVKSYLVTEGSALQANGETLSCESGDNLSCDRIVGNGEFAISPPDTVTADGQELRRVARIPESTAMPYLYGLETTLQEGLNQIPLAANAQYTRQSIVNGCSGCGAPVDREMTVGPVDETAEVWGVAFDLPEALVVPVNEQGILQQDTVFEYAIRPAAYVAGMAQVLIYADGSLRESVLAPLSGAGQVILPAGYDFAATKNYQVQVLLGNPGDVNAVYSDKIPIMPVISEVDLHIDGLPESVEDQVGAFVLLNNDYDESDADATITQPDIATPGMIPDDDELKQAWVSINAPDMVGGSWQITTDDPTRLRIYYESNGESHEMKADDPPRLITGMPLVVPLYLEGMSESDGLQANSLSLNFVSATGELSVDAVPLTVVHLDMAVDGNRDTFIKFNKSEDEAGLFWVNNDRDVRTYSDEDSQYVEDDADTGDDSLDNVISCKRDLEDLNRLHVVLGNIALAEQLKFTMEMVADDTLNQPMVNLFKAASPTQEYLGLESYPDVADIQISSEVVAAVGKEPVSVELNLQELAQVTPLLYEGRKNGKGNLTLKVHYTGIPVLEKTVHLSLYDMSYFYDHFIVAESGQADLPVNTEINPEGVEENASRTGLYQPATDEYVMFVHGWNMEQWQKKRWAETVFKRLWWRGYKGKVGLFDWPCRTLPSLDAHVNYDRSEHFAWSSAVALAELLKKIKTNEGANINVLAHSQGNVVASEAIHLADKGLISSYVASQAAASASLYTDDNQLANITPVYNFNSYETPEVMSSYPGLEVPGSGYLNGIFAKVGNVFSYYNIEDYALVEAGTLTPGWEFNNETKPDGSIGYGYDGDTEEYTSDISDGGFYYDTLTSARRDLEFAKHDYEIYAFGAESRTKALGSVSQFEGFVPESNSLDVTGSRDLQHEIFGYNNKHYSHSRQFRSNIVDERNYWQAIYTDFGLN